VRPARSAATEALDAAPLDASTQLPTLMGEVTLNTRGMFRNRSGRPRSAIRQTVQTRMSGKAIR
jgi:hypothetical protein